MAPGVPERDEKLYASLTKSSPSNNPTGKEAVENYAANVKATSNNLKDDIKYEVLSVPDPDGYNDPQDVDKAVSNILNLILDTILAKPKLKRKKLSYYVSPKGESPVIDANYGFNKGVEYAERKFKALLEGLR